MERADGAVLVRKRPPKGMLGGLWEFPSAGWDSRAAAGERFQAIEALSSDWRTLAKPVRHGFTHFELALEVRRTVVSRDAQAPAGMEWADEPRFSALGLSTLMKKVQRALRG